MSKLVIVPSGIRSTSSPEFDKNQIVKYRENARFVGRELRRIVQPEGNGRRRPNIIQTFYSAPDMISRDMTIRIKDHVGMPFVAPRYKEQLASQDPSEVEEIYDHELLPGLERGQNTLVVAQNIAAEGLITYIHSLTPRALGIDLSTTDAVITEFKNGQAGKPIAIGS